MALRLKTIEYGLNMDTAQVAAAGTRTFATLTVYIPETTSRVFVSVAVHLFCIEDSATAVSVASATVGVRVGAGSTSTVSVAGSAITNSGEDQSYYFIRDATTPFNTDFGTGTSQTVVVTATVQTAATSNCSAKLVITYQYDDSATTRIKTVRIPIESATSNITTVLTELGTNQIPNLDTFLPEASKVYRDIFFEIHGNTALGTASAPNPSVSFALDAEAVSTSGLIEDALITAIPWYQIWKRTDMATNATHAFKVQVSNNNLRMTCLGATLVVTYEYNHSTTTRVMNSLVIAQGDSTGFIGGTTSADTSYWRTVVSVQEPGPISPAQSGALIAFQCSAGATVRPVFKQGATAQAETTYTIPATVCSGSIFIHRRSDSGSAGGVGMALTRGYNELDLQMYRTGSSAGTLMSNAGSMLYLNYRSGVASDSGGDANHNHSVFTLVSTSSTNQQLHQSTSVKFSPPETEYYLQDVLLFSVNTVPGTIGAGGLNWTAERFSDEEPGAGWASLSSSIIESDNETGPAWSLQQVTAFKRFPGDVRPGLMDITSPRSYRANCSFTGFMQYGLWATYHSNTYTITGNVSGYTGDGSGILVSLVDTGDWVKVKETTTTSGGAYSFTWYDDTREMFTVAYISGLRAGASTGGYAS